MENSNDKTIVRFSLVPIDYSKPYEMQPECKRHVIGAYANLALHNMILVVNTVMLAVGMDTFDQDTIKDAFGTGHGKKLAGLDNIQKVNLQKRLYRHFSFLKRMKLEDEKKKSVQLQTVIQTLSDFTSCLYYLRNFYTHYRPFSTPEEIESQLVLKKRLGERLTFLFENSCQMYKDRENLTHEDNEVFFTQREEVRYFYYWCASNNLPKGMSFDDLKSELKITPNNKRRYRDTGIEYTLRNDSCISGLTRRNGRKCRYTWDFSEKSYEEKKKDIQKGKGEAKNVWYEDQSDNGIVGSWTQFDRNPDYYASMSEPAKGLSDVGLIYFLCLFLDKQDSFQLMEEVGFTAQCTFTKDNSGENIDFLQELMCLNRIRMVKSKLDTEMTDTSLALDMLYDLRKCPKQLYEVFTKEARKEFKDLATVEWEEANQQEAILTEETRSDLDEETDDEILDHPEQKNRPKSTLVRWQDRFPQMALNYIDTRGLFDDIRFQLDLGKYRYAFFYHEDGKTIDGEKRLRILQKDLHGFGRIQEVDQEMKNKWKDLFEKKYEEEGLTKKYPDKEGQLPYVTEQSPQYAIDEKSHSIGLRWEGWDNDCRNSDNTDLKKHHLDGKEGLDRKKMFIPYLPLKPVKSADDSRQTNQAEKLLPPQAMMNIYDLPGLIFYQYLLEKYGHDYHDAEHIIKDKVGSLKLFFTNVAKGSLSPIDADYIQEKDWQENYTDEQRTERKTILANKLMQGLKITDIPEKLCKYLLKISIDYNSKLYDSAEVRLKERLKRVEKALKDYRDKKNRIGTKDNSFDKMHATIKTGSLALSLMRNITDWLPSDGEARQILTGQNYMVLQSAFAMLGQVFEDESGNKNVVTLGSLRKMLVKAKIMDTDTEGAAHPFLHQVFTDCKKDSVEQFYELYLSKEIAHIKSVKKSLAQAKGSSTSLDKCYRQVPFLHHERARWNRENVNAMQKLAKDYLELPIQLPNGLFANNIYHFLKDLPHDNVPQERWSEYIDKLEDADKGEVHLRLSNNVSYLINLYFKYIEDDQSQPYYNTEPDGDSPSPYRHIYRVFKKYFGQSSPTRKNQKIMPEYTISEIREILKDKNRIRTLINDSIVDDVIKFENKLSKKKDNDIKKYKNQQWTIVKDENSSGKVRRNYLQRQEEVDRRVEDKKQEIEKQFAKELEDFKIGLIKKKEREFKKVENNERVIRRYKVQDILMFVMARQILNAKFRNSGFGNEFYLKNVMNDSLLDKTIDFEFALNIKKNNNEVVKKTIKQDNMKIKDYGQFYKFLSDRKRVTTLLSQLQEPTFPRDQIENEFSYYDTNRSEVFRLVYCIEYEAYQLCPYLTDDSNALPKELSNIFYFFNSKNNKLTAKRNNFYSLLKIVAEGNPGVLDDNIITMLQSIRNSFGHNTYEVDLDDIFKGKEKCKKLPEVANGIKEKMSNKSKELKNKTIKTKEP